MGNWWINTFIPLISLFFRAHIMFPWCLRISVIHIINGGRVWIWDELERCVLMWTLKAIWNEHYGKNKMSVLPRACVFSIKWQTYSWDVVQRQFRQSCQPCMSWSKIRWQINTFSWAWFHILFEKKQESSEQERERLWEHLLK